MTYIIKDINLFQIFCFIAVIHVFLKTYSRTQRIDIFSLLMWFLGSTILPTITFFAIILGYLENVYKKELKIKLKEEEYLKTLDIRRKVHKWDTVIYKDREYVVTEEDYLCGGNCKAIGIVIKDKFKKRFKRTLMFYENEINKLQIAE